MTTKTTGQTAVRRARSPLSEAGMMSYQGLLAHDITVIGELPEGTATRTITYFVMDMATDTIVGTVALPDAFAPKVKVAMPLKVASPSSAFAIGIFNEDGIFEASPLLSIRNAAPGRPQGAAGTGESVTLEIKDGVLQQSAVVSVARAAGSVADGGVGTGPG